MYVSFYSPLVLRTLDVDGRAVPIEPQREFTGNVYSVHLDVPAGATTSVRLRLRGTITPEPIYRLMLSGQPAAVPDQAAITVVGADGWTVERADAGEHRVVVTGPTEITVGMKRT